MKSSLLPLHDLGLQYHTDKAVHHGFTVLYDYWFSSFRKNPIRLLELGILLGSSLRMWHDYFVNAERIYGADILFPEERNVPALDLGSTVELLRLDQSNRKQLRLMPKQLDLIIDDGGHTMEQQQVSLLELFDHLNPGGIYILEDLQTSQPSYAETHGSTVQNNTWRLLLDLQNQSLTEGADYFISFPEFQWLCSQIASIEIVRVRQDSIVAKITKRPDKSLI